MAPTEWWRDFFRGVSVELWLRMPTDAQTESETDFLQETLGLTAPSEVLDVPCGGGRHSLALAARGHTVTGVDYSTEFLAAARVQSETRGLAVTWENREMRDLPWPARFDAAFCFGNSFGYLDDDGNRDFLAGVFAALKPAGKFLVNSGAIAETLLPAYQERRWYRVGDILFLIENQYDHARSRIETNYIFVRDGYVDERRGSQRVYTVREL